MDEPLLEKKSCGSRMLPIHWFFWLGSTMRKERIEEVGAKGSKEEIPYVWRDNPALFSDVMVKEQHSLKNWRTPFSSGDSSESISQLCSGRHTLSYSDPDRDDSSAYSRRLGLECARTSTTFASSKATRSSVEVANCFTLNYSAPVHSHFNGCRPGY